LLRERRSSAAILPGSHAGKQEGRLVAGLLLKDEPGNPAKAENKDAAWKLIEHWTSPPCSFINARPLPTCRCASAVTKDQVMQGDDKAFLREAIAYAQQKPLDIVWPENSDILFNVVSSALEDIVLDKQKPQDALSPR